MQELTRIRIHDAMDFIRAEGGCSDMDFSDYSQKDKKNTTDE